MEITEKDFNEVFSKMNEAKMMPSGGNGTKKVLSNAKWSTDPKGLDVGASDYQVLKDMTKFQTESKEAIRENLASSLFWLLAS